MYLVSATVPGLNHLGNYGSGNQDAIAIGKYSRGYIITICDGCGSQPHSNIGADFGVNAVGWAIRKNLVTTPNLSRVDWNAITKDTLNGVKEAVNVFLSLKDFSPENYSELEKMVVERFLFTTIAVITMDNNAVIASFGDGMIMVDDEIISIEAPIINSPPYIGYLLLKNTAYHTKEFFGHLSFRVIKQINLEKLKKGLIIGTDGLKDIVGEDLHHPALVQNSKSLQRWLNTQMNKCHDDTSLVVVRTDKAQRELMRNRQEIAGLKQKIAGLQADLISTTSLLEEETKKREQAEKELADINQKYLRKNTTGGSFWPSFMSGQQKRGG